MKLILASPDYSTGIELGDTRETTTLDVSTTTTIFEVADSALLASRHEKGARRLLKEVERSDEYETRQLPLADLILMANRSEKNEAREKAAKQFSDALRSVVAAFSPTDIGQLRTVGITWRDRAMVRSGVVSTKSITDNGQVLLTTNVISSLNNTLFPNRERDATAAGVFPYATNDPYSGQGKRVIALPAEKKKADTGSSSSNINIEQPQEIISGPA